MKHTAITQDFKQELADKISLNTVQLTWMEERKREEAAGTSVLISYSNQLFLISSGHTFQDNEKEKIGINLNGMWHSLIHFCAYLFHPPKNEMDDDMSVFQLNDELSEKILKEYKPIFLYEKDFNFVDYTPQLFTFLGYPLNKTRHHPIHKWIERAPYTGWMSNLSNKLEYYASNQGAILFACSFDRHGTTKGEERTKQIFPKMQGMSGCGLFSIHPDYSLEYSLIGILNRYSKSENKLIGYHMANFLPILDSMLAK